MELKAYFQPLIKWWWLLLVAVLISSISAFFVTRDQPPIYEARVTLVIGRAVYEPNPSSTDMWMGQQLASYYADLAHREVVRNATLQALGIEWLPEYRVSPIQNSQLLEIVVTDMIPLRAMVVANELAKQLIQQTPANQQQEEGFVGDQLTKLESSIRDTEAEIAQKEDELRSLNSARQIEETEAEIGALQDKIARMQTTYATLLSNTSAGAANTLSIIESASLPQYPVGPNKRLTILLSAAAGLAIAVAAAYLLEYVDDTVKTPEEITRLVKLAVISLIPRASNLPTDASYVGRYPRSPVAEAFRSLRTNIEFLEIDQAYPTISVCSPDASEGKSFVAVNLAMSMVHAGKKVILLDGDLRKPSLHRYLNLENHTGLSDLLRGADTIENVAQNLEGGALMVITSGRLPPNPTELLSSKRMNEVLDQLGEHADVVVVDGPPCIVSDAVILASQVKGVLLVFKAGRTSRKRAINTVEQLNLARAKVLGIVLNQLPRSSTDYYYYYSSQYPDGPANSYGRTIGARLASLFGGMGTTRANGHHHNESTDFPERPLTNKRRL